MDYSYFNPTAQPQQHQQQPYHLFGLPPAGTPHPEDFGTVSQPSIEQVAFDYNSYGSFPSSFPQMGVAPPHSPPESFTHLSNKSTDIAGDELVGAAAAGGGARGAAQAQAMLENFDDVLGDRKSGRSSSEEKEHMTPAQNRRKAQNRAAQRAFRERKERHVRELEQKLNDLEQTSTDLHADNERLKRELARIATENEILRATGSRHNGNGHGEDDAVSGHNNETNGHNTMTGPLEFSPIDVQQSIADSSKDGNLPHRIVISDKTGERLLNARATWDMIQDHSLFKQGLVDIGDVCDRLKGFEKCDGQGPVFEEGRVKKAIEESVGCGNDELI
ncbi:hypothetical protein PISL3812_02782 [Talaromyces islandicus]|uniref:BZIP domain-containing protein n=1 Tax=Talaromyces islandicus TaxID=28573 RepID=A0A0U1LT62_TALIS|nr:hypothetical protein PISL3812_02782 [Talaromyces islandicus]